MPLDAALIVSATLLGLAGAPHCAAMCAAPCAAATGPTGSAALGFHIGRVVSYAAVGALAASSMAALAAWAAWSPAVRPLWVLLHCAALGLGAYLLWQGRQPAWMARFGQVPQPAVAGPGGWQRMQMPTRAVGAGLLWAAWPCGLLQSALLVAAMAPSAPVGGAAMFGFALASAPGLVLAPWLGRRLLAGGGTHAVTRERRAVRAAGGFLLLASGWALLHGVWAQVTAFCAQF